MQPDKTITLYVCPECGAGKTYLWGCSCRPEPPEPAVYVAVDVILSEETIEEARWVRDGFGARLDRDVAAGVIQSAIAAASTGERS